MKYESVEVVEEKVRLPEIKVGFAFVRLVGNPKFYINAVGPAEEIAHSSELNSLLRLPTYV